MSLQIKVYNQNGKVKITKICGHMEQTMFSDVPDGEVAEIEVGVSQYTKSHKKKIGATSESENMPETEKTYDDDLSVIKNSLKSLIAEEKDKIYREVWHEHVCNDIRDYLEHDGQTISEEAVKYAADRYVFDGEYDCELSYWDNIQAVIKMAMDFYGIYEHDEYEQTLDGVRTTVEALENISDDSHNRVRAGLKYLINCNVDYQYEVEIAVKVLESYYGGSMPNIKIPVHFDDVIDYIQLMENNHIVSTKEAEKAIEALKAFETKITERKC